MISSVLLAAILVAFGALMLTAALSPLETLSWWAGWTETETGDVDEPLPAEGDAGRAPKTYVVYLSGVASISGQFLLPRELAFIRRLRRRLPRAAIVADVFPYSPGGMALFAAPRLFDRLWRRAQMLKLTERQSLLSVLINIRNILQVMVSADHRYGPIFNQGVAHVIEKALSDDGMKRRERAGIVIIGYSGGAQVAAGAAAFLTARLPRAEIEIIGIGGVLASDPGLSYVRKFHHIVGERDRVHKTAAVMFPERWPIMAHSEWNAGLRDGRIQYVSIAGVSHAGVKGYFGRPCINGVSNCDRTVELVATLIEKR